MCIIYVSFCISCFRGKGIGKEAQGIVKPIKATKKNDVKGIGIEESSKDEFFPWWEALYNKSAAISTDSTATDAAAIADRKSCDTRKNDPQHLEKWLGAPLTDRQLFEACGERTANTGARRHKKTKPANDAKKPK